MNEDVVVVGAGVMGAATARALARRGREVTVLERFEAGNVHGSSHGVARIFRLSYHEERYVRMAMESVPLWRALEEESGERLLVTLGGVDCGAIALERHVPALAAAGAAHEVLSGRQVAERFPFLRVGAEEQAVYQPDAGITMADATVRAMLRSAVAYGAEVRERTPARTVRVDGGRVEVETDGGVLRPRVVVVTAGAWVRNVLGDTGIDVPVTPTRETVAYFRIPEEDVLPPFIDWRDPPFYSLPSPGQGLKVGEFRVGPAIDPEDLSREPDTVSVEHMSAWVAERFPTADPEPHLAETCLYTNTADEDFILERHGPVVVGSPCSGHGFKFAPWIGERLADLAEA